MRYRLSSSLGCARRLPRRRGSLTWVLGKPGLYLGSQVWKPPFSAAYWVQQQALSANYEAVNWVNFSISSTKRLYLKSFLLCPSCLNLHGCPSVFFSLWKSSLLRYNAFYLYHNYKDVFWTSFPHTLPEYSEHILLASHLYYFSVPLSHCILCSTRKKT